MAARLSISTQDDIAAVRDQIRRKATEIGFPDSDIPVLQSIGCELSLYAIGLQCRADLLITSLSRAESTGLSITLTLPVPMQQDSSTCNLACNGLGIPGAQRVCDVWEWHIRGGKTIIHAAKWKPAAGVEEIFDSYLRMIRTSREDAWQFGRTAVLNGVKLLTIAAVHQRALAIVSDRDTAEQCFRDVLAAFDMVNRACGDAYRTLGRVNDLLEQETERIAQTLHDDAGQTIAVLGLYIDSMSCHNRKCAEHSRRIRNAVDEAGDLFRALSHELRSPMLEDDGLAPALRYLCASFSSRRDLTIEFADELQTRLPAALEHALYRAAQAGLTNVVRHSGATSAEVRIFKSGSDVVCSIRDNGVGLARKNPQAPGLGLSGLRERARALGGSVELVALTPHGAELRMRLPQEAPASAAAALAIGQRYGLAAGIC